MEYISRVPAPPLNAYIDDLYYIDGVSPYPRLKTSTMPSSHLMVNVGHPFHVIVPGQAEPFTCTESWWMGLQSTYVIFDFPMPMQFYGVHFKPSGIYPFLRLEQSELHNQIVPVDAVWGRLAAEMRERLYDAPTVEAGLALFEQLMFERLHDSLHGLDMVQYAIGQIARCHGGLSIRALSDHIGVSENHLGTQFRKMVGVPPKELARFYRFFRVVSLVDPAQPVDWTQIARQAGFYDLSHLNKDFLAFTGLNPTEYFRLRQRFYTENPDHPLDVGPLPTD